MIHVGKKKKGKTKVPLPIATREEGARTEGGNPPEEFVPRHIHFTDNTRFDRDLPPTHPLQDDSAWYEISLCTNTQHIFVYGFLSMSYMLFLSSFGKVSGNFSVIFLLSLSSHKLPLLCTLCREL